MESLSWATMVFYCIFSIFLFEQQRHVKNFNGASRGFGMVLSMSAFLGMVTGIAYLVYYGWNVTWWAAAAIFICGLIAKMYGGFIVAHAIGPLSLSMAAFVGWPISAYFMFAAIPR